MNDIVSIIKQSFVGIFLYFLAAFSVCVGVTNHQPKERREGKYKRREKEGDRPKMKEQISLSLSLSPVADVYSSSSAHNPVTSALFTNSIEPARRMHENR